MNRQFIRLRQAIRSLLSADGWSMNMEKPQELEELGKKLGMLQQPKPPKKISQAIDFGKVLFDVVKAKPGRNFFPPCQQIIIEGDDVDLNQIPMIRPYPKDAGKIIKCLIDKGFFVQLPSLEDKRCLPPLS